MKKSKGSKSMSTRKGEDLKEAIKELKIKDD
jgi:hypothetical protein